MTQKNRKEIAITEEREKNHKNPHTFFSSPYTCTNYIFTNIFDNFM